MGRMSEELNCLTEEGSLYRPIKVDPQERAKQKQFNNPYVASHSHSQYENHEEELEEVNFDMRKRRY
jgi:hypothetical protein